MKSNEISDGFGNSWEKCKLGAECGLHVVRPGKAQCWCKNQESSRVEVQAAREEIANLEEDNDRLREEVKTAKIERDLAGWDDYAVIAKLKIENAALREALTGLSRESIEYRHKIETENAALRNELECAQAFHRVAIAERDELRAWKEGKLGIEEYYSMVSQRDTARAESVELREQLEEANRLLRIWSPEIVQVRKEAQP